MPLINRAVLDNAYTGFKALYMSSYDKAPTYWDRIAMEVSSETAQEDYGWLEGVPGVREWLGERYIKSLAAAGFTIKNRKFESTVAVPREVIEDDKIGLFRPMFSEMGLAAKSNPDKLLFKLMKDGFTSNCYDGQLFFDSDHPMVNEHGQPGTPVSNVQAGAGDPWFLLDTTRAVRPFIFQNRLKPDFQAMDDPKDENVFMRDKYLYGTRSRCNVGFGMWQFAFGSKATLDSTNFQAARVAMMSLKMPDGQPMGVKPNVLVVGPTLEEAGHALVNLPTLTGGASNPYYKRAELIMSEWL